MAVIAAAERGSETLKNEKTGIGRINGRAR